MEIAETLGISKATLYKQFASKREILGASVDSIKADVLAGVERLVADSSLDFLEKLVRLMTFLGDWLSRLERVLLRDLRRNAPEVWQDIDRFRREKILVNFSALLEAGVGEGVVRADLDRELVLRMFLSLVQSFIDPDALLESRRSARDCPRDALQGRFRRHPHRPGPRGARRPEARSDRRRQGGPDMRTFTKSRPQAVPVVAALAAAALAFAACSGPKRARGITGSGTIEAREVSVASRVGGQILEIRAEEGSRVRKGDVLILVDHEALDIQLRQAEAGVALADAQLALLKKGSRVEDVRQGEEALRQAGANLKVAADDAGRMRELASRGSVTTKQKEDAEARLIVAQAQETSAKEAVSKLRRLARPEEINAAEARLAQAVAASDLLRKTISDGTVVSPVDGIVTRRPVEAGELVSPGTTVLTVSELDQVHVMLFVTEKELGRVRLGGEADVTIDAAPGRVFKGRVTYISPEAEFTPKNIQTKEDRVKLVFGVKVEIPNPDGALKPGLPADAVIVAGER